MTNVTSSGSPDQSPDIPITPTPTTPTPTPKPGKTTIEPPVVSTARPILEKEQPPAQASQVIQSKVSVSPENPTIDKIKSKVTSEAEQKEQKAEASSPSVKVTPDEAAILLARLKVAFGPEFLEVFGLVMDSDANATQPEIQRLVPRFKQIIENAEICKRKANLHSDDPEVGMLDVFKSRCRELAEQYVNIKKRELADETRREKKDLEEKVRLNTASPEELRRLSVIDAAFKTRSCFISFYAKVLDLEKLDERIFSGLEGYLSYGATNDFLNDLNEFLQENRTLLKPDERKAIARATNDLYFAHKITTKTPSEAAASLVERLEELAKTPKEKRRPIIFPGGSPTHAVLYKIEMTESGKYNFSVIDTGAGINKIHVDVTRGYEVYKTCDLQFTEVSIGQLSADFFTNLFGLRENAESMDTVYDYLKSHLLVQGVKMGEGEERRIQQKGSCTVRCILEWLRKEFGKELFSEFNAWMTQKAVRDVKKEVENISKEALKWIFPGIESEEETKEFYDKNLNLMIARSEANAAKRALKAKRIKSF